MELISIDLMVFSYDISGPSDEENTTAYAYFEGRIVVSNVDFLRFNFFWDKSNPNLINRKQL